ncbi:hypothetical protein ABKV19_013899 [Rosa sericea]
MVVVESLGLLTESTIMPRSTAPSPASEPLRSWSSNPSFTSLKKIPRSPKTSQTQTLSSTALSRRSPHTMSSLPRTPASTPGPTGFYHNLNLVGIPKLTGTTKSGGKHIEFVSDDRCKRGEWRPLQGIDSIDSGHKPRSRRFTYEMNGEIILRGVLPPSIAKLPYLTQIDFTRNFLSGNIPSEWASTKSFNVNNLTGPIPAFLGNITTLKYLNLETSMFSGTVPPELGKLVNLQNLDLSFNKLEGSIPDLEDLKSATNLEDIYI